MTLIIDKRVGYAVLIVLIVQMVFTALGLFYGYQADRRICPVIEVIDVPIPKEREVQLTEQQRIFRARLHDYNTTLCK
jgi:hypothetical protein